MPMREQSRINADTVAEECTCEECPAPAPDVYDGPVTAGTRFQYKDSVFVPDGRRGSMGEFLDAEGSGISEPNLRGMYRPIPAPAPEPPAPPKCEPWCGGGLSPGTGSEFCKCMDVDRYFCTPACMAAEQPMRPCQPVPAHEAWTLRRMMNGWKEHAEQVADGLARRFNPPSAPPVGASVCKGGRGKCGTRVLGYKWGFELEGLWFCSQECRTEHIKATNPPPSDPVTVATGGDECPGCDDHCEDEKCKAAHGPCVDAAVATGGVPAGFRLGAGWVVDRTYLCSCTGCRQNTSTEYYKPRSCGKGACAAHAVRMGAIVPIDTARSVPPGPVPVEARCRCGHSRAAHVNGFGQVRDCGFEGDGDFCACNLYQEAIPPAAPASGPGVLRDAVADLSRRLVKATKELVAEYDACRAARAEVEQLRGKLAASDDDWSKAYRAWSDATTARVRSMREAFIQAAIDAGADGFYDASARDATDRIVAALRALPLDAGTATGEKEGR